MSTRFRHWAVIVLLALLPATVFAQACELGCALSHQPQHANASTPSAMPDCDHATMPTDRDSDRCSLAALCGFAHLVAFPTLTSIDKPLEKQRAASPDLVPLNFSSTHPLPAQRPPAP